MRGVVHLVAEYGGEKVGEFTYSDGSTPDVVAGSGLLVSIVGVAEIFRRDLHAVDGQVNIGLKYRTIPPAGNQDAMWLRFPLEALVMYRAPAGIRVGAGATVHLRNVLSASGEVLNDRVEFQNTTGLILQAEYLRDKIGFDVRYTALEYGIGKGGSGSLNASSIGVGLSFYLGG